MMGVTIQVMHTAENLVEIRRRHAKEEQFAKKEAGMSYDDEDRCDGA